MVLLMQVLVGRNNKQIDELSNRVAKVGDVWMHARGCPGAHLLLRASVNNRKACLDPNWKPLLPPAVTNCMFRVGKSWFNCSRFGHMSLSQGCSMCCIHRRDAAWSSDK